MQRGWIRTQAHLVLLPIPADLVLFGKAFGRIWGRKLGRLSNNLTRTSLPLDAYNFKTASWKGSKLRVQFRPVYFNKSKLLASYVYIFRLFFFSLRVLSLVQNGIPQLQSTQSQAWSFFLHLLCAKTLRVCSLNSLWFITRHRSATQKRSL